MHEWENYHAAASAGRRCNAWKLFSDIAQTIKPKANMPNTPTHQRRSFEFFSNVIVVQQHRRQARNFLEENKNGNISDLVASTFAPRIEINIASQSLQWRKPICVMIDAAERFSVLLDIGNTTSHAGTQPRTIVVRESIPIRNAETFLLSLNPPWLPVFPQHNSLTYIIKRQSFLCAENR